MAGKTERRRERVEKESLIRRLWSQFGRDEDDEVAVDLERKAVI